MSIVGDETRWLDATAQAELVRGGQVHATELLDAAIERIEAIDHQLNAVVIRWFDEARSIAASPLPDGPFAGVPFLLKDLWAAYAGQPLSNGNAALRSAAVRSESDTTLVGRFRAAGLVTAGRTNSPEFGSVPTTEPVAWGPTRNPWDLTRSPGGSSGGSAAAVAAGMVPFAHASDGGGSIRIPASCCGLVGLKPSQGRITLGPFRDESNVGVELCVSRSVRDTAALLDAVHGPGVGDTVIAPAPLRPYVDELRADPGRLRIGILDHHPQGLPVDPQCTAAARHTATLLESLGHTVVDEHPAALDDPAFNQRFGVVWATNMAAGIERVREQLGRDVTADDIEPMNWVQAEFAKTVSGVEYALGLAAMARFRREVGRWWTPDGGGFDLLLTPTIGIVPFPIGEFANNPDDPMAPLRRAAQVVAFTPQFNTTGQPAISLPLYWTADGLPVGVQLVAAYGREDVLIRIAAQLEQAQPWADRRPPI